MTKSINPHEISHFDEDEYEFGEIGFGSSPKKQPTKVSPIRVGNYIVKDNRLFKEVENKAGMLVEREIGFVTLVDAIEKNLETKEVKLILKYYSFGSWEKTALERGKLIKTELKTLLNLGIDIAGRKADDVFDFLDKHEKLAPKTFNHNRLGWIFQENGLAFRLSQAFQKDTAPFSQYKGKLQLEPKGLYSEWHNAITEHVIGYTPLELILSASFTAPIIGLFNKTEIAEIDSLLLNIVGNSTTGKTTAGVVAASPFGSPSITNNGIIQSFNGTSNALQSIISGNFGVPIIYDETSMNMLSAKAFTSLIYKLAQNKDKARLNKESVLQDTERWATVIMFTGEASILENANANEGLHVRLFEFKNITWTKDAHHAETLKDILLNNYGHAGIKYVEYLLTKDPQEIKQIWTEFKAELEEKLPDSKFSSRVGAKFALILTGAKLANEALGIEMSLENITKELIKQEEASMDIRELAPKFYEALRQYIIQNKRSFKYKNDEVHATQQIYGKLEVENDSTYCYIFPIILKKIASELGYPDLRVLLDDLKSKGYLKHDKNKNIVKKQVFAKDELEMRSKVLEGKDYSPKGDYTYCIVYEGDILAEFATDQETRIQALQQFNPTTGKKRIIRKRPTICGDDNEQTVIKSTAANLFGEDE